MPTVVPVTPEAAWLAALASVPAWDAPAVPTLVIAPHPDDESLGAGGLIVRLRQHAVPVTVVAITDGENAYLDSADLGLVRVREQVEALHRMGVPSESIHRIRIPDGSVSVFEDRLFEFILPLVSAGMRIVAPWPHDFHPDHEAAGRAAERVALVLDVDLFFYLFWTWHRATPNLLKGRPLLKLALSDSERSAKMDALRAHASQFQHWDGQPILSEELIKPAQRPFEVYLR